MREQLMRYIDLLFAGAPQSADIKQEILQNTLDHYDDLVAQGKSPEAAYSLAIAGIGDVSELLGGGTHAQPFQPVQHPAPASDGFKLRHVIAALLLGLSVMLYIICPIPLFVLQNEIGLCALLAIVAVATAMMVLQKVLRGEDRKKPEPQDTKSKAQKSVDSALWCVITAVYLLLSFLTSAWHITWVIFLIGAAVQGIVNAAFDLKEEK